jgi:hypothetical protein
MVVTGVIDEIRELAEKRKVKVKNFSRAGRLALTFFFQG